MSPEQAFEEAAGAIARACAKVEKVDADPLTLSLSFDRHIGHEICLALAEVFCAQGDSKGAAT